MPRYRDGLPRTERDTFLTDGGLETTLVFHEGIELPHFAAFVLLDRADGRDVLARYYRPYMAMARERGVGFVLDSPTWRANPDWAARLGYDRDALRDVNRRSVAFLEDLRAEWERPAMPCILSGVIGPRGDGYKDGSLDPRSAEDYHAFQIEALAETEADMISAMTMNNTGEAIGIARAAKARGMPCVISFTVETDGRLADGTTLREAVERVDEATGGSPAYYMINCAHPTHLEGALRPNQPWVSRLGGLRANASTRSHAELDESETLDIGDPADLGRRYAELRRALPKMRVLGGCCGTDHRHLAAICEECLPRAI